MSLIRVSISCRCSLLQSVSLLLRTCRACVNACSIGSETEPISSIIFYNHDKLIKQQDICKSTNLTGSTANKISSGKTVLLAPLLTISWNISAKCNDSKAQQIRHLWKANCTVHTVYKYIQTDVYLLWIYKAVNAVLITETRFALSFLRESRSC